jgi:hypothetical protein
MIVNVNIYNFIYVVVVSNVFISVINYVIVVHYFLGYNISFILCSIRLAANGSLPKKTLGQLTKEVVLR